MTQIIASLSEVSERYDAVLCDLWGCYHDGVRPHAGAVSSLRAYRERGGLVSLLTNAPRPAFSTAAQLARMGAPTDTHDLIVTSGDATIEGMRKGSFGPKCHHIGPPRDKDLFADFDIERVAMADADFILCSGLDDDEVETPDDYADRLAEAARLTLPMVCANPDVIVDRGETRIFCAGALAEAYAAAGGTVHLYGKPHLPIYEMAGQKLAALAGKPLDRARILAIGDGPATDVLGGMRHGIDTLFIAGGLGAAQLLDESGAVRPAALAAYNTEHAVTPTYTIAMLA